MKRGTETRKKRQRNWSESALREASKECLKNVPPKYKEMAFQCLMEYRDVFSFSNDDLVDGISTFEVGALIPKQFRAQMQSPIVPRLQQKLYGRLQNLLASRNIVKPALETPYSNFRFFAIRKKPVLPDKSQN